MTSHYFKSFRIDVWCHTREDLEGFSATLQEWFDQMDWGDSPAHNMELSDLMLDNALAVGIDGKAECDCALCAIDREEETAK